MVGRDGQVLLRGGHVPRLRADVDTLFAGGSDDAGFVQVMQGRSRDRSGCVRSSRPSSRG